MARVKQSARRCPQSRDPLENDEVLREKFLKVFNQHQRSCYSMFVRQCYRNMELDERITPELTLENMEISVAQVSGFDEEGKINDDSTYDDFVEEKTNNKPKSTTNEKNKKAKLEQ